MTTVVTSFLLLTLATCCGHVWGDVSPLVQCPLMCQCYGNYSSADVLCKNSHLTYIPHYPAGAWRIRIQNNNIKRVRSNSFPGLHKLTSLRLKDNNIRTISERAFSGLTALVTLTIVEDSLSSFGNGVFRFVNNVVHLNMQSEMIDVPQTDICMLRRLQALTLRKFHFPSAIFHRCFKEISGLKYISLTSIELKNISRATFYPFRLLSLTTLSLIKCGIRRLKVDMFEDLSGLLALDISWNDIAYLPNDIFAPVANLTTLNLMGNKLKIIYDELLQPLRYLKNLYIGENRDMNVTFGEEFLNMTRLERLMLHGSNLVSLNNDTFRHLGHSPVNTVDMSVCSIQSITKGAFRPLRNITTLHVGLNPINGSVLHDAFYGLQGSPLRHLSITTVNLHEYSTTLFEGLRDNNVKTVTMKDCYITTIKRGVFRNLDKVTSLDIRKNSIQTIEKDSFRDLSSLSILDLRQNNLVEMPSAVRLGITPGLSQILLEGNSIKVIRQLSLLGFDNLTTLSLGDNRIRTIGDNAFASTPHLKVLSLAANKISHIQPGTFNTLPNLQILVLRNNDISIQDASLFQRLRSLQNLDISHNAVFGRQLPTFRSVFQNLPSLEFLKLTGCGMWMLPVDMFTNTTQLTNLFLTNNDIKSWTPEVFAPLRHLRVLTLARNKIVSLNVASFSHLTSLRQLDLSLNPFACNCDLMWFLEYVHSNNIFIYDITVPSKHICASPKSLHGVPVMSAGLSPADCVSHTDLVVTLSTTAAIFLSAIVFALVYKGRWYIRYYIFLIRSRRRRYLELAAGSYVYDAFVAHNSSDASWVVRHLLPQLEAECNYRLCLHQRDWSAGREISENIAESIEASRKVIVVLSNNFAHSQWCRMELEMANHRRLSNWRSSLVLVLLETISPENQNATLRNLLTTQTYLEWNERAQEKFWIALRRALRPPKGAPPTPMRTIR